MTEWMKKHNIVKKCFYLFLAGICLLLFYHCPFDYLLGISCPGCGRTLFDLEQTIAEVKAATAHLQGLKIGIMGCIVNGPGEMADADYGYVGAGRGKVSLYKKKECIEKNIPEEQAVEKLIELIKSNGDYVEK